MWFNDEKEGPGKFIYLSKRQSYEGEWVGGKPRCGTIKSLINIRDDGAIQTRFPILQVENPNRILEIERDHIYEERVKRLVGYQ
jgi:hypothetical protein